MFHVRHFGYCGMADMPATHEESADARAHAAQRLRRYRKRFNVVTLERGKAWEILEPADCTMVPDACGTLRIIHQTFECRECGTDHETSENALHCCAFNDCEFN